MARTITLEEHEILIIRDALELALEAGNQTYNTLERAMEGLRRDGCNDETIAFAKKEIDMAYTRLQGIAAVHLHVT